MRGRRPLPAAVKRAKGNPGKRRIVEHKPDIAMVAPASRLSPPSTLSPIAREVWKLLAPRLEEMRFLRDSDLPAFARYCSDLSKWWACELDIRKRGVTYVTNSKHIQNFERINPRFIVQEKIEKRLVAQEDRFGMSPASRQRMMQQLASGFGTPASPDKPKTEGAAEGEQPESLDLPPQQPLIGGLAAASNAKH